MRIPHHHLWLYRSIGSCQTSRQIRTVRNDLQLYCFMLLTSIAHNCLLGCSTGPRRYRQCNHHCMLACEMHPSYPKLPTPHIPAITPPWQAVCMAKLADRVGCGFCLCQKGVKSLSVAMVNIQGNRKATTSLAGSRSPQPSPFVDVPPPPPHTHLHACGFCLHQEYVQG
jgi:hypothetical protein